MFELESQSVAGPIARFFGDYDGSLWKNYRETQECRICSRKDTRLVFTGLHTGCLSMLFDNLMRVSFGFKENSFYVCKTHKEREIEAEIDKWKDNENVLKQRPVNA